MKTNFINMASLRNLTRSSLLDAGRRVYVQAGVFQVAARVDTP
jgi:hypothetical protein